MENNSDKKSLEELKKRLEQLEKKQKRLISEFSESILRFSFLPKIDLFSYIMREIIIEGNIDLLKEYLVEK